MDTLLRWFVICIFIGAGAGTAAAQRVERHARPDAPLAERWDWAFERGQQDARIGFWVGYSIERLMAENEIFAITHDYTIFTSSIEASRDPSLHEILTGRRPDGLSRGGEESVQAAARRALNQLDGTSEPRVLKEVALLFRYRSDARRPGDVVAMYVLNTTFPVDLERLPLYWLGPAENGESLALLEARYADVRNVEVQEHVVEAVGAHTAPDRVIPFLTRVLESRAANPVREEAAEWLGRQGEPRVLSVLVRAAREDHASDVREEAAEAICEVPGEEAVDALITLAHDAPDAGVREEAVEGLGARRSPKALQALERVAFEDRSQDIQEEAVEAMAEQPADVAVPFLVRLVREHRDADIREEAVEHLGEIGTDEAVEALERVAFEDRSEDVQEEAVEALAQLSRARSVPFLIRVTHEHRNPALREEAVEWLAELAPDEAAAELERVAFEDSSPDVRDEALQALAALPRGVGIPALIRAMQDHRDPDMREEAAEHLEESRDPRARRALRDRDSR